MICFLSTSRDSGDDNLVIRYLNIIYCEEDTVLNIDITCHFDSSEWFFMTFKFIWLIKLRFKYKNFKNCHLRSITWNCIVLGLWSTFEQR